VGVPFDVGLNVTTKTSSIFKQDLNGMTLKIFGDHQRSIPEAERLSPRLRNGSPWVGFLYLGTNLWGSNLWGRFRLVARP